MKKAWFSAAELAVEALPGMPGSRQNIAALAGRQGWDGGEKCRPRAGRGGGIEYHYTLLPGAAQAALVGKYGTARRELTLVVSNPAVAAPKTVARVSKAVAMPGEAPRSATAWAWYDGLPNNLKDKAVQRLEAVNRIETLRRRVGRGAAVRAIAEECGVTVATIHNWLDRVRGVARVDWLPALAPAPRGGGGAEKEIQPEVWEAIKTDYLRLAEMPFAACYENLKRLCIEQGWKLPAERTLRRRMKTKIPEAVRVYARKGAEAVKKLYPAQTRDRSMFHALEAVNADGHKFDVFVRWPDGKIGRPVLLAFQDLYSGKMLSWRYGKGENRDMVRLAFGDMCMSYGIPDKCWLDNGRAFASKWLTGGTPNRYRFKVKPEEPHGIMTQLGVEIHWTTPYAGQSKPIERAFGDFARNISRGIWFQGAYTGNTPLDKPEDYATRAIPFEEFKAIVDQQILLHNARTGRQSHVCGGKLSFNEAFEASYEAAKARCAIRLASPEHIRICLLAAEGIKPRQKDGSIFLLENRYWHEALIAERGKVLTVRFDPDNVHVDLPVYRRDGTMVCVAQLVEAVGFADTTAAREHAAARGRFIKGTKEVLAAERTLSIAGYRALQPPIIPSSQPDNEIIRTIFEGSLAVKPAANAADDDDFDMHLARGRPRMLRAVEDDDC